MTAVGFYEKLGYASVGHEFMEVGIPHLRMEKSIKPSRTGYEERYGMADHSILMGDGSVEAHASTLSRLTSCFCLSQRHGTAVALRLSPTVNHLNDQLQKALLRHFARASQRACECLLFPVGHSAVWLFYAFAN